MRIDNINEFEILKTNLLEQEDDIKIYESSIKIESESYLGLIKDVENVEDYNNTSWLILTTLSGRKIFNCELYYTLTTGKVIFIGEVPKTSSMRKDISGLIRRVDYNYATC